MRPIVEVEIWSDVVCPWCYIGKRRFESAVAQVVDEVDVRVVYRPYQLDPTAPSGAPMPVADAYARKFGGAERAAQVIDHVTSVAAGDGLGFRMDRALRANTLLAHRLLLLAEGSGHQHALKERLLQAYFIDGLDVGDPEVLTDCAADVGMPRDVIRPFLASDDGRAEVTALISDAAEHGITAVPTYVFAVDAEGPGWMVPGAQDPETFVTVLRKLAARAAAVQVVGDDACTDDTCAVAGAGDA